MSTSATNTNHQPAPARPALAFRIFSLLLLAYPVEFRREYGSHMAQVFRDLYRTQKCNRGPYSWIRFWLHTLVDFFLSAAKEHIEDLGKEGSFMNNLRRDAVAVLGCVGIIVIAFALLDYGKRHEVSSILMFGFVLDALVVAGVVGNLIVFLLVKTTRLNPLRTALWTFLIVTALPVVLAAIIGNRMSPDFGVPPTLVGYVVSFMFWVGLHWAWAHAQKNNVAGMKSP